MAKVELKIGVQTGEVDRRINRTRKAAETLNRELEKLKDAEIRVKVRKVSLRTERLINLFLILMMIFFAGIILQVFIGHRLPLWVNLILPGVAVILVILALIKINRYDQRN